MMDEWMLPNDTLTPKRALSVHALQGMLSSLEGKRPQMIMLTKLITKLIVNLTKSTQYTLETSSVDTEGNELVLGTRHTATTTVINI